MLKIFYSQNENSRTRQNGEAKLILRFMIFTKYEYQFQIFTFETRGILERKLRTKFYKVRSFFLYFYYSRI